MAGSSQFADIFVQNFGPLFYGCLMGIGCFGVCLAQTWNYAKSNDDTRSLRAVVALLFSLVFACTVLDGQVLSFYLLENYGNPIAINQIPKDFAVFVFLSVVVTFILLFRVEDMAFTKGPLVNHRLSCIDYIRDIDGAVLFNQLLTIPVVTTILTGNLFDEKDHKITISLVNLLAAASQALITLCLWYSFKSHMDESSSTPQPIFKRLGLIVVIRGTFLTLAQLVLVILYLAQPDRLLWTIIHQVLPPLYYTTAISTLNIRLDLLEQPRADEESRRDSVLEPGVYVRVSTPAGGSPSMEHINQARQPVSALHTRPVETERVVEVPGDLRSERRADTKEIRMEWTPPRPQDDSDLFSPVSQNTRFMPALSPNRLQ
ncbi:hypothetical protein PQX77_019575 [Marasmius sp. AFHP31]|nr:hypothetical protein PQX77_019575 [Marasmius sp. AFHP31]